MHLKIECIIGLIAIGYVSSFFSPNIAVRSSIDYGQDFICCRRSSILVAFSGGKIYDWKKRTLFKNLELPQGLFIELTWLHCR